MIYKLWHLFYLSIPSCCNIASTLRSIDKGQIIFIPRNRKEELASTAIDRGHLLLHNICLDDTHFPWFIAQSELSAPAVWVCYVEFPLMASFQIPCCVWLRSRCSRDLRWVRSIHSSSAWLGVIHLWNPAHPYQHTERTEGVAEGGEEYVRRQPGSTRRFVWICEKVSERLSVMRFRGKGRGRKAGRMMVAFIPCFVPWKSLCNSQIFLE